MSFTPNGVRSNQWRLPEVPASAVGRCNTRKLPLISPFLNLAVRQTHHYVRISTTPETPQKPLKKICDDAGSKSLRFLKNFDTDSQKKSHYNSRYIVAHNPGRAPG
jgi:hypothetical protein